MIGRKSCFLKADWDSEVFSWKLRGTFVCMALYKGIIFASFRGYHSNKVKFSIWVTEQMSWKFGRAHRVIVWIRVFTCFYFSRILQCFFKLKETRAYGKRFLKGSLQNLAIKNKNVHLESNSRGVSIVLSRFLLTLWVYCLTHTHTQSGRQIKFVCFVQH